MSLEFWREAVAMTAWPVRFNMAFIAPDGTSGPGEALIAPGSIVCRPTVSLSRANQTWTHTDCEVSLYVARLVPPWFNVALSLHDGEQHFAASTWLPGRRKLSNTLTEAGFSVTEHRTWLHRGTTHG